MHARRPLILASASPRRAALLTQLNVAFTVVATNADEVALSDELAPREIASRNARAKARAAAAYADQIIIGADTIVLLRDEVLGKPTDTDDAARMLRLLSGETHSVITGLCIRRAGCERVEAVETRVTFSELSDDLIDAYLATGEPLDKAGAYGIQGRGAVLVERIEGDYFNVVGLPLARLAAMLRELGVKVSDLW